MVESAGDAAPESFESALERLATLVAALESGSLGLTESIAAYERGVGLLKRLHEELAAVEERVKVLVRIDADGRPVLEEAALPGGDAESPAAERTSSRKTRATSSRGRRLPGMDDGEASA